jgi:glycosyltransferase involved in cell wall biosynthesis
MTLRRRIRLAFCLDSFALGGTELNAVRTAEALDRDRFEMQVFYLQDRGPLRSRYQRLGVQMTHLPIPNLYSLRTAAQGARLARALQRGEVDVVHSHDIYCNILVAPWARALSGSSIIASRRWRAASRPRLAVLNRWCSSFAHCILANSSSVAELVAREEGVPRRKIVEIPNFLSDDAFGLVDEAARMRQRRVWGVPEGAFVTGIVARLSPVKNHVLLVRAMARLGARFHLVVIGDGPLRMQLEELAGRLHVGARVHFVGEVISAHNLHQYLDVSVLCSLSEGFPNSVIEAMAAARPVVATPVGGVPDAVVDGVTGLFVPPDDPARLAEALTMLEADPSLRRRLGEAGRDAARMKYRQSIVIAKLSELYETLANRRTAIASTRFNG